VFLRCAVNRAWHREHVIRRAGPEDLQAIVRIFRDSRAEAMPWLPVLHTAEEDAAHFAGRLEDGQDVFVFDDGEVAGFAVLHGDELDAFYVAPEHQRRGVGAALFRHAQELRPERFGFWVFRDNDRARRFYERHGARFLYETDGAGNEERTPDVRYEWRPSPVEAEA
jgi:GNAT superfamily N-acetyltransferase